MQQSYCQLVKLAALVTTVFAFIFLIIKIFSWWYTESVSLLAALIESIVDITASLINLLVIRYSLQPADSDHTFGHGKAESLAVLAQSMFISGSSVLLFLTGIKYLINPTIVHSPMIGVVVTIISLISTIILVSFQKWVVKQTSSQAIRADMLHYQADVIMNAAILIALILSSYNFVHADALLALAVGIFILCNALKLGYNAIQVLLDGVLPKQERDKILRILDQWPNIKGIHDLRTRQSGSTRFIQFHLELEDNLPLLQAHDVAVRLKKALLTEFPGSDIIIHQDPCSSRNIGI
ncbi:cation-efflux pump FieF [Candidatus Pantoea edessiphila]|uniref:Cation-efflux pump FieF n=1 Tax=Candidatus Pantoea edessiphila TaxID=2044610 RepID=A0A2P5SZ23_9GAMM|nr:CDF family cation-efflux transporter FieF [Candidatus Pantoea edessiphila]MBK4775277.1 CDF family cation-efflux transporter FieF [Pantoea sp. Edef]PPI87584.1 cation-efflux pump FieF [Candidatus Pantoea edessiphila]